MMMHGYGYGHGMGAWGWFAMVSGTLVGWALLTVVAVLLYRLWIKERGPLPGPVAAAGDAERILAERFARGDIDEAEYRSRLSALRGGTGG